MIKVLKFGYDAEILLKIDIVCSGLIKLKNLDDRQKIKLRVTMFRQKVVSVLFATNFDEYFIGHPCRKLLVFF